MRGGPWQTGDCQEAGLIGERKALWSNVPKCLTGKA